MLFMFTFHKLVHKKCKYPIIPISRHEMKTLEVVGNENILVKRNEWPCRKTPLEKSLLLHTGTPGYHGYPTGQ